MVDGADWVLDGEQDVSDPILGINRLLYSQMTDCMLGNVIGSKWSLCVILIRFYTGERLTGYWVVEQYVSKLVLYIDADNYNDRWWTGTEWHDRK